jgi:DtxR family Mn-dependent transcriptional regulator
MNEQIIIQDALKHIAECEYDRHPVSADHLAAEISISNAQAERVLGDLETAGLLRREGNRLALTDSGREYAMHVLRAHRLYETYLARKTGLGEAQWHTRAHVKEHQLSERDVDDLARALDHPRFDPHGDPIPTAAGELPPKQGRPLTDYPAGWEGRVVHVEDEPPKLYARIATAGIAPGTRLRLESADAEHVRIRAEGRSFEFPRDVAAQITVVELRPPEAFDESLLRLSALGDGERATVVGLSPLCRGLERSRLLDLGVVPGTAVERELSSPSGSPVAYRIRGACIALRREQAERILIRKAGSAAG